MLKASRAPKGGHILLTAALVTALLAGCAAADAPPVQTPEQAPAVIALTPTQAPVLRAESPAEGTILAQSEGCPDIFGYLKENVDRSDREGPVYINGPIRDLVGEVDSLAENAAFVGLSQDEALLSQIALVDLKGMLPPHLYFACAVPVRDKTPEAVAYVDGYEMPCIHREFACLPTEETGYIVFATDSFTRSLEGLPETSLIVLKLGEDTKFVFWYDWAQHQAHLPYDETQAALFAYGESLAASVDIQPHHLPIPQGDPLEKNGYVFNPEELVMQENRVWLTGTVQLAQNARLEDMRPEFHHSDLGYPSIEVNGVLYYGGGGDDNTVFVFDQVARDLSDGKPQTVRWEWVLPMHYSELGGEVNVRLFYELCAD